MRKLEISVQSGSWYDEMKSAESIRFIKECGFEGVDYNINNVFSATFDKEKQTSFFDKSLEELYAYYRPLKEALKEEGIAFSQFHGLFPMYYPGEDALNDYLVMVTEKMMAVCEYLNCKMIVIHPWSSPGEPKEVEYEANLGFYRKLIPAAKQYGVTICLENMFKHHYLKCIEGSCSSAEEACWYVDTLNEEAGKKIFGFCFDVGHANVMNRNIYQYITKLGKRLTTLHIHDNNGVTDSHLIPYSQLDATDSRTNIQWEEFLRALKEIGYEGPIAFETFRGIQMLPQPARKDGLKLVGSIGRYFRDQIEK